MIAGQFHTVFGEIHATLYDPHGVLLGNGDRGKSIDLGIVNCHAPLTRELLLGRPKVRRRTTSLHLVHAVMLTGKKSLWTSWGLATNVIRVTPKRSVAG